MISHRIDPRPATARSFGLRLAAIDLDGTLLGPDLTISAENLAAIGKLQAAGLEVVLASGRHHASILPFATQLPGIRWIVSAQGADVSDLERATVLSRDFLSAAELRTILDAGERLGLAAVFYTPTGVRAREIGGEPIAFYHRLSGLSPTPATNDELMAAAIYKAVWIGDPATVATLATHASVAALDVQKVRSHARFFELLPHGVTKASGLAALVAHLGFSAAETVVFGDADNDIPMFEWAATSVAMPHGWPSAKARAHVIAPDGPAETALARAVDIVLEQRAVSPVT